MESIVKIIALLRSLELEFLILSQVDALLGCLKASSCFLSIFSSLFFSSIFSSRLYSIHLLSSPLLSRGEEERRERGEGRGEREGRGEGRSHLSSPSLRIYFPV